MKKTWDEIKAETKASRWKISDVLSTFRKTGEIPQPKKKGRPLKLAAEIKDFIDVRTLQKANLNSLKLQNEITQRFGISISKRSIIRSRKSLKFTYQPPRHNQQLSIEHI
jgi:transposase